MMHRPFCSANLEIDVTKVDSEGLDEEPLGYFYTKVDKVDFRQPLSCTEEAILWNTCKISSDDRSSYRYSNVTLMVAYGLASAFLVLFYYWSTVSSLSLKGPSTYRPLNYRSHLDCGHYKEALSKSILFLEAQRSGYLPETQRVKWRKDSGLSDGNSSNVDLLGGYYDAGDNVKFGFPMAFSMTVLSWSILENGHYMAKAGELDNGRDAVRWGTDYFLKTYPRPDELWAQVGEPLLDHNCWARPEDMETPRTAYMLDPEHPGSDLAAETAAALAAASIVFKDIDPEYAKRLLEVGSDIFRFADAYRGKYSDHVPDACPFYCSYSGYKDELLWGATWLYKASRDVKYLLYIRRNGKKLGGLKTYRPHMDWDNKYAGAQMLLTEMYVADPWNAHLRGYKDRIEELMCSSLPGLSHNRLTFTPGGLVHTKPGTNLQYVASSAFLLTVYAKHLKRTSSHLQCNQINISPRRLIEFAQQQVDYILGVNPMNMSYMVGFGDKFPRKIHHRAASIPSVAKEPKTMTCLDGWTYFASPKNNPNIIQGAVVGGPDRFDKYEDFRGDWLQSEPAIYINAPLAGALAYFYGENPLLCDLLSLETASSTAPTSTY